MQKNIMKVNAFSSILCSFLFFIITDIQAQKFDGLHPHTAKHLQVYYSDNTDTKAIEIAEQMDRVIEYYAAQLQFKPTVTLLVLSPEDWPVYTRSMVYGMPHYTDAKTLIVASENNDFWKSFIPPMEKLPAPVADEIRATYTGADGELTMESFFDLLAIHELGHAFHQQKGLQMQRLWLGELFVNIFLHNYIAENEPHYLPALTVFPKMVINGTDKSELTFTSLPELDKNYELLGQKYPRNYGWYQCRWHFAAGEIYEDGGTEALKNIWKALLEQQQRLETDEELSVHFQSNRLNSLYKVMTEW